MGQNTSKFDSKCYVIINCGPLQVFLVLKISVRPAQWFEFDMPGIANKTALKASHIVSNSLFVLSLLLYTFSFCSTFTYDLGINPKA